MATQQQQPEHSTAASMHARSGGIYGDGIGDMAESIGAKVVRVSCAYDSQWSVADAEAAIESAKPVLVTGWCFSFVLFCFVL